MTKEGQLDVVDIAEFQKMSFSALLKLRGLGPPFAA
jgi:hypothetical protein